MIASQLLAYVAISVSCVLKASSLDTCIAAVYEHAVLLLNDTRTPVAHEEEALVLTNRNLGVLEGAITVAAKQVPLLECAGFSEVKEWSQEAGSLSGAVSSVITYVLRYVKI